VLLRSHQIAIPSATVSMMHDFAITQNYVVWMDFPVVFDPALTVRPGMLYR
jgi:carotenoid cleavage dioxygenase